jgi:hypothetical protein
MFLINMKINHLNMVITVHHRRNRPTRGGGGEPRLACVWLRHCVKTKNNEGVLLF